MVGSDFAAAAALITMGAVLGRASPLQLIIITFFELMFYSANEAINLNVYEAADVGTGWVHAHPHVWCILWDCRVVHAVQEECPGSPTQLYRLPF